MPIKRELFNIWKNVQELDLRPIRALAGEKIKLAIVGAKGAGRRTLAEQMRSRPAQQPRHSMTHISIVDIDNPGEAERVDIALLVVGANTQDVSQEQELLDRWSAAGKKVILFYSKIDLLPDQDAVIPWIDAGETPTLYGSTLDRQALQKELADAFLKLLPGKSIPLGRQFPLLREPLADHLINETCMANAAYSLGTGLAEIIPVFDLPLNVTDMIILTKAQALLVYKLGLMLGLPKDWQYYVGEFSSVIGGGFLWRQIARQLIGLIPVWGIAPKVAVAYAGTYVVGHVVLSWYETGRHVSKEKMSKLWREAFAQGKRIAHNLMKNAPLLKLSRKKVKALPAPRLVCNQCRTVNDPDAKYCKHCGTRLTPEENRLPSQRAPEG